MNKVRNKVLIPLVGTGAIALGVASLSFTPAQDVVVVETDCVMNDTTMTMDEATTLIAMYKQEVEATGGFSTVNVNRCKDFFDKLDTIVLNNIDARGGLGITIEDLTELEYRATLEALLIKRENNNETIINNLRQAIIKPIRSAEK